MTRRVATVKQFDYEIEPLKASIGRCLELIEFDPSTCRGKRVLLKPNMLGAYAPQTGICTHPDFVAAVASVFIEAGAVVGIGDSPNGIHPLDAVWKVSGMRDACAKSGAAECRFEAMGNVERDGIRFSRAIAEADLIVNLPKFKTHSLTVMTLAAKNLFGCINGMAKTKFHKKHPDRDSFAKFIAKVADAVHPALTIVDGVVAMEGDGPSGGRLIDLGAIVAGTDTNDVDAVCCELIGLPPLEMDTLKAAKELGLWIGPDGIEIAGDGIEALGPKEFALPSTHVHGMRDWWISRFVLNRIWSNVSSQPVIDKNACKSCGMCIEACPVSAISQRDADMPPLIYPRICIQCFCCREVCPHGAIQLKESILVKAARLLTKFRNRTNRSRKCHPPKSGDPE